MNSAQTKESDASGRCVQKVPMVTALDLELDETDGPLDWHHYHGRGEIAFPCAFFDRVNGHDAVFTTDDITVEYIARSLWAVLGASCLYETRIPREYCSISEAYVGEQPLRELMYDEYLQCKTEVHEYNLKGGPAYKIRLALAKASMDSAQAKALVRDLQRRLPYPRMVIKECDKLPEDQTLLITGGAEMDDDREYVHILVRESLEDILGTTMTGTPWLERYAYRTRHYCFCDVIDAIEDASGRSGAGV